MLVVKDFAANFLAAPISADATGLAVVDASGLPDLSAPGSFCWLVLQSATDRSKVEIVRAVGQSGNTYTIQRGWNTTPIAFAAGDYVEQRITVSTFAYYTEQLVSGLAEAGSGNLLRDGGPVLTALIQALSNAVTLDGAETITGAKTFTGETLYPATPVAGTEISNKNYVDSAIRSALSAINWAGFLTTDTVQDITAAKVFKANLSVSGAMVNFSTATAVNVPTPTVRPNAMNKGFFDDWFDANAEASSGLLMRVNGPRDQQIANALANTTGGAYVSASAPPSPFQGMRWFDITVGRTFIYYIDASNHGQWVEENPQSPDWITTAPVIAGIAQNTTMLSHRNLLINGAFNVWQRGDSFANISSGFTADRWKVENRQGQQFKNVTKTPTAGASVYNVGDVWFLNMNFGPATYANDATERGMFLQQWIEDGFAKTRNGKVTLSIDIATDQPFVVAIGQHGISSWRHIASAKITPIDNNQHRHSVTFNVPDYISGSDGNRENMLVYICFGCNTTYSNAGFAGTIPAFNTTGSFANIFNIQLERGEVATPFEHRPYGYALSLCQRYFVRIGRGAHSGAVAMRASSGGMIGSVTLPCPMRVTPSFVISARGNVNYVRDSVTDGLAGISSPAFFAEDISGAGMFSGLLVTGLSTDRFYDFDIALDAEL